MRVYPRNSPDGETRRQKGGPGDSRRRVGRPAATMARPAARAAPDAAGLPRRLPDAGGLLVCGESELPGARVGDPAQPARSRRRQHDRVRRHHPDRDQRRRPTEGRGEPGRDARGRGDLRRLVGAASRHGRAVGQQLHGSVPARAGQRSVAGGRPVADGRPDRADQAVGRPARGRRRRAGRREGRLHPVALRRDGAILGRTRWPRHRGSGLAGSRGEPGRVRAGRPARWRRHQEGEACP